MGTWASLAWGHRDALNRKPGRTALYPPVGSLNCDSSWMFECTEKEGERGQKVPDSRCFCPCPQPADSQRTCYRDMRTDSSPTQRVGVKAFTEVTEVVFYL